MTSSDQIRRIQEQVARLYRQWREGSKERWEDLLSPDSVVLGPGADEVYVGISELTRPASSGAAAQNSAYVLEPEQIRVGMAARGHSGWFWAIADPSHEVAESDLQLERVSGAAAWVDERWSVTQLYVSRPLPNDRLGDYQSTAPQLTLLPQRVDPGAAELIDLLQRNLTAERLDLLPRREDIVVLGTDPAEVFEGATAYLDVFAPLREQIEQAQSSLQVEVVGGIQASLTPDGQTGCLATHLRYAIAGQQLPITRLAWVFNRLDGAGFSLVCDHHAFPTQPVRHPR